MEIESTTRQIGPGGTDLGNENSLPKDLVPDILPSKDHNLEQAYDLLNEIFKPKDPSDFQLIDNKSLDSGKVAKLWGNFRSNFINGPKWFQMFRSHFTTGLNYFGIAFNSLAVMGKAFLPEKLYNAIDKNSEWYSKYIIPISFGWNALEAGIGHRFPEALSRLIPAVSFWALPFYNFNLATGVSSAMNYLFEHVKERHGGKNPGAGNIAENIKQTINTSVDVFKDMFTFNFKHEDWKKQIATALLFAGSFGGMAFARQERDSFTAKLFGNMRNLGGLIADYKLIFNNAKDPQQARHQREVGAWCSTASILNIFMRWVNPEMARMLNHIAIAADDMGLTRWAQVSKEDNDRELAKIVLHSQ